ncbi:MAG TPA: aspartate carbamoyltransferase catalytic subunit [Bryobacteraceae bacterium]|nr:aspartate carbamoyltransferase catalytic subunit [Bryobacteraceae bacterium]
MPGGLLGIEPLDRVEMEAILERARHFQRQQMEGRKSDQLRGRMLVNLFFESSTRTRTSFEIAAKRLGADAISITASGSSVDKGESLVDTLNTLGAMRPDAIVMRHAASGAPHFLARHLPTPIINAGDGTHEHPTQALLDARTILDRRSTLEGLCVAIIGDIAHSRVARSNVIGLRALGAEVVLVGPPTLLPEAMESPGIRLSRDLDSVLPEVDAVMLLRIQRERIAAAVLPALDDYARNYRMDARRLQLLGPHAIVMHPGPYNRGVELTEEVLAFGGWRYAQQVAHGVSVRMAVLDFLVRGATA